MSYYLEAKKSLGQNFLKNKHIIDKIAEAGEISDNDIVIEIGPGTGELTAGLLEQIKKVKGARLIAIEKDNRAIPILEKRFVDEVHNGQLTIVEGDFLEMDIKRFLEKNLVGKKTKNNTSYKIIANIPYYITGAIIRKSLEAKQKPSRLVLLVQKEVAERIVARNGKGSILSQSVQVYGDAKILMTVSKGNFVPVPKVDSAALIIENISNKQFDRAKISEEHFFDIIHAGFAHKRKKLASNLKELFSKNNLIEKKQNKKAAKQIAEERNIEEVFKKLNIDPNIRAENLSIDQWVQLACAIQ